MQIKLCVLLQDQATLRVMKLTGKTITSGFTALWRGLSDDCVDEPALATKSSEVRLSTLNEVGEQGTEAALPASGNMPTASSPAGNSVGGAASDPAEDQRKVQCSRLQASARLTRLNIFCCELSGIIAETVLTEKHLETMRIATFAPPIRALVAARAAVLDPYLVDFIARHRGRETNSNDDLIPHGGKADTEFCAYLGGCEALDSDGLEDQSWDARWARLLQRNKATKCAQPRMHARHASVVSCESTPVAGEPASVTVISLGAGFEARCCSAMFEKTARWVCWVPAYEHVVVMMRNCFSCWPSLQPFVSWLAASLQVRVDRAAVQQVSRLGVVAKTA